MKKLLLTILLFNISVSADIDIGEDFAPGDIVSSEVFNNKFSKIKKSIGVMTDDDLIGSWECTIYATQRQLSEDRKSTRLNSSHSQQSRMPSSA